LLAVYNKEKNTKGEWKKKRRPGEHQMQKSKADSASGHCTCLFGRTLMTTSIQQ